jgi:hypothetical protein
LTFSMMSGRRTLIRFGFSALGIAWIVAPTDRRWQRN